MSETTTTKTHDHVHTDSTVKNNRPSSYGRRPYTPREGGRGRDAGHGELALTKIPAGRKAPFNIPKGEQPVRIGSLMGLEQVGQCIFIEYHNDIIIVDAGMEFSSSSETMGADYIIPDISYVKKHIKKLRGIVLTHGHLDHIGALRDILEDLNFPIIYTTPLTLGIIKKTFDDPKKMQKIKYKIVNPDMDILKIGCFTVEFVHVNHNIPETMALAIHTPKGLIFNSADFKIDHTPAIDKPADLSKIARIGVEGVRLYIGDSLGSSRPGNAISEKVVGENLDGIIRTTKSRMLIATFASNVGRVIQIIQSAVKANKYVFLSGRSMVNNVEICQELGYIKVPKNMIRNLKYAKDVESYPDEKVVIICTGAQGEEFSALARIARGEHDQITLKPGDTILMSASTIPGNELQVTKMMNDMVIKNVNIITNDAMDVHASGHGGVEDHKIMLGLLKPEYFLPFYTQAIERYHHKKLGLSMGIPDEQILMPNKNGSIIEMYDEGIMVAPQALKLNTVLIDGKGKGHLSGEFVVKARKIMSEAGIVSIIFKVDTTSKDLVGNIQIESRGFVYSSEVKDIHTKIVEFARKQYYENLKKIKDTKYNLKLIKDELTEYVVKTIGREPLIIPMFVYINRDVKGQIIDGIEPEEAIVGMTLEEQGDDTGEE